METDLPADYFTKVDPPTFTHHEIKLSDVFRKFAQVLDDRFLILQKEDKDGELIDIIHAMKKLAWEKCGGAELLAYGDPGDQSSSVEDYENGAEYRSKTLDGN